NATFFMLCPACSGCTSCPACSSPINSAKAEPEFEPGNARPVCHFADAKVEGTWSRNRGGAERAGDLLARFRSAGCQSQFAGHHKNRICDWLYQQVFYFAIDGNPERRRQARLGQASAAVSFRVSDVRSGGD